MVECKFAVNVDVLYFIRSNSFNSITYYDQRIVVRFFLSKGKRYCSFIYYSGSDYIYFVSLYLICNKSLLCT